MDLWTASFYGILDTGWTPRGLWAEKCRQLIEGGADLIQLRAKNVSPAERLSLLQEILPLFETHQIPLVINDDIDLCLQFPGLGLHVGQDDLSAREARDRLGPDRILGLSTHSIEQARGALELGPTVLSYFAVGPVFATQTKPDYVPVGLQLVTRVTELKSRIPFFCIGGINRRNLHEVKAAGARRVVIVSDVLCADHTAEAVREVKAKLASH
jgi:thiamine-phosphate pyrophosphorylase